MSRVNLPIGTWLVSIVGITVAAFGCADDNATTEEPIGSTDVPGTGSDSPSSTPTDGTPSSVAQGPTGTAMPGGSASQPPSGSANPTGAVPGATGTDTGGTGPSGPSTSGPGTSGPTPGAGGTGGISGSGAGGDESGSGGMGGSGAAGSEPGSGGAGGDTGADEPFTGTCTDSEDAGRSASGTGPHDVVIETNSEDGIRCGTIFRPADLGGDEKYPIFVWGEGGCSQNGLSNQAAMGEIASWGYFIVADGTPGGDDSCSGGQDGAAFLDYITWAIAENDKPCSAYYKSLDTTKIAADGFSCGGLMSENVAGDPRFTAIGITSSGLMGANDRLWDSMHAPFKIMNGGSSDVAYENGLRDYDGISSRGIPILYFSKTSAGHGGDLNQGRGDFNLVNLAWLNWQLKGDEGSTGKAFLYGPDCEFCTDSGWDYKSANIE